MQERPDVMLDSLWNVAPDVEPVLFRREVVAHLPERPRRYLKHAIVPGRCSRRQCGCWMHGEIQLGRWLPFSAEQVIRRNGNVWAATLNPFGIPLLRVVDRLVHGFGP